MNFRSFMAENDTYFFMLWFGVIFALVGFLFLSQDNKKKRHCTVEVTGVFDHFNQRYSNRGKSDGRVVLMYNPVYRYQYNDQDYTIKSSKNTRNKYSCRQEVTVMLNPDVPSESYIAEEKHYALIPAIAAIAGLAVTIYSLVFIIKGLIH